MSGPSSADREWSRKLLSITPGSSTSSQIDSPWKSQPVPLQPPHNVASRRPPTQNPYARIRNTLQDAPRGVGSGNQTAQATVLNNAKRPRISGEFAHEISHVEANEVPLSSRHFSHRAKDCMLGNALLIGKGVDRGNLPRKFNLWNTPHDTNVIDVDEVDTSPHIENLMSKTREDESGSSEDPINSFPSGPTTSHYDLYGNPCASRASEGSGSLLLSRVSAADGAATTRLRERLRKQDRNVSTTEPEAEDSGGRSDAAETIDSFSDEPVSSSISERMPRTGNVRRRIRMLEQPTSVPIVPQSQRSFRDASASGSIPTIDLSKQSKLSKKDAMKPKQTSSRGAFNKLDDPLSEPSGFASSSAGPSKQTTRARVSTRSSRKTGSIPPESLCLPLEGYSWGSTFTDEEVDIKTPKYWLTWEAGTDCICIRRRAQAEPPLKAEIVYKLQTSISSITHTRIPFNHEMPVIVSVKPSPSRVNQPDPMLGYQPGSKGGEGTVAFKFFAKSPGLRGDYATLIEYLKTLDSHPAVDTVDGPGAKSLWQRVINVAELAWSTRKPLSTVITRAWPSKHSENISVLLSNQGAQRRPTTKLEITRIEAEPDDGGIPERRSARTNVDPSPSPGPDELILVYPPSGAGALNINKSDLKRLDDKCYLNDTLIEFGLKLWLADLKDKNPVFAEQVHVFSSFFYKKLNVRDKDEGYQSVRKWTSKVDLFQKKYIVVPINEHFHWYLAIICNPEHVLLPPPASPSPPKPMTRKRKRESDVTDMDDMTNVANVGPQQVHEPDVEIVPDSCPPSPAGPAADSGAEDEVEGMIGRQSPAADADESRPPSALGDDALCRLDDMNLQYPSSSPQAMNVDEVPSAPDEPVDVVDVEEDTSVSVDPWNFHDSKAGAPTEAGAQVLRINEDERDTAGVPEPSKTAHVFIFDSLGSKHPQAIKLLSRYLELEAKDKKGNEHPRPSQSKLALVPSQPNYCDCGVYVLHFMRVFLENPESYTQLILSQKSKGYGADARKADWKGDEVKNLRGELRARILALSEVWKADRLVREEARKKDASSAPDVQSGVPEATGVDHESDDEVIIEETTSSSKPRGARPS